MNNWGSRILNTGANIDIQRSDGRVHSAIVRNINRHNSTVTVEWYEKGEAKGKEVEIGAIQQLNPSIRLFDSQTKPRSISEKSRIDEHHHQTRKQTRSTHTTSSYKSVMKSQQAPLINNNIVNDKTKCTTSVITDTSNDEKISMDFDNMNMSIDNTDQCFTQNSSNLDPTNTENISFSLVNSSFGWIKGNSNKMSASKRRCLLVKDMANTDNKTLPNGREEQKQKHNKDIVENNTNNDNIYPKQNFQTMIKEFQKKLIYSPLSHQDKVENPQICVCVRKRPLNFKEIKGKEIDVITIPSKNQMIVHEPKLKVDLTKYLENQQFTFDYTFNEYADNALVYRFTAKPLVECMFEGGMATCFAYGQTGSGKTHTMGGEFLSKGVQNHNNGIYAMAARDVFHLLKTKYKDEQYIIECSFFEIYRGKVFDLLNNKNTLRILEDHNGQVQIVGLKNENVDSVDEIIALIQHGMSLRTSGQTSVNQHSSRSHGVFQLILRKKNKKLFGKFSLIDLAGNERGADTSTSDRITRLEGAEINKSLLALKECIRALGRRATHRPFRASKLTQVLRDSFIGNQSRTCMISTISPSMQSCEHTLNTLRYADRVKELSKELETNPRLNPTEDIIDEIITEIDDYDDDQIQQKQQQQQEQQQNDNGGSGDNKLNMSLSSLKLNKSKIVLNIFNDVDNVDDDEDDDNDEDDEDENGYNNDCHDVDNINIDDDEDDDCITVKENCSFDEMNNNNIENESFNKEIFAKYKHDENEKTKFKKVNIHKNDKVFESVNFFNKTDLNVQHKEIIVKHQCLIEKFHTWIKKYNDTLKITNTLDFDAIEYSNSLNEVICEQIEEFKDLKERIQFIKTIKMKETEK